MTSSATQITFRRLSLALIAGGALLLLAACGDSSTPAPEATATAVATATPTSTPEPAVNSIDPDQYLSDVNALITEVTAESDAVAALFDNADVQSESWRTETAAALRQLASVLGGAADIEPPAQFAAEHQQFIDATSKYSWAADMLANGVESLDLNVIDDAAALLTNATAEFAVASAQLSS